jgi:hypothetical protein
VKNSIERMENTVKRIENTAERIENSMGIGIETMKIRIEHFGNRQNRVLPEVLESSLEKTTPTHQKLIGRHPVEIIYVSLPLTY